MYLAPHEHPHRMLLDGRIDNGHHALGHCLGKAASGQENHAHCHVFIVTNADTLGFELFSEEQVRHLQQTANSVVITTDSKVQLIPPCKRV